MRIKVPKIVLLLLAVLLVAAAYPLAKYGVSDFVFVNRHGRDFPLLGKEAVVVGEGVVCLAVAAVFFFAAAWLGFRLTKHFQLVEKAECFWRYKRPRPWRRLQGWRRRRRAIRDGRLLQFPEAGK
jgi:hypothetical protein